MEGGIFKQNYRYLCSILFLLHLKSCPKYPDTHKKEPLSVQPQDDSSTLAEAWSSLRSRG
jgi:hypothetical protein